MPIANGAIIDFLQRQPVDRNRIGGPDRITVFIDLKHAGEHRRAAVRDYDSRAVADRREIEAADPGRGIIGMVSPEKGTWQENYGGGAGPVVAEVNDGGRR
jgi:hypothetical protein